MSINFYIYSVYLVLGWKKQSTLPRSKETKNGNRTLPFISLVTIAVVVIWKYWNVSFALSSRIDSFFPIVVVVGKYR